MALVSFSLFWFKVTSQILCVTVFFFFFLYFLESWRSAAFFLNIPRRMKSGGTLKTLFEWMSKQLASIEILAACKRCLGRV